ncbi:pitrilysin family protein [Pseudomonas sp. CCI3.2]|uniref:M16 family metallopeptidase n=1 Tax=unclassified Pseudomonas TaxID=196821 RepID=UPI002AC9A442|nr:MULTISPECIES: pitrilysin family protein [unclassified Pseudomonas]MEB0080061.1 pitrilysin family protein [Pseudomonas sp. MH10out]MEB0091893.1 pitrilysin family protein [Pseudomonas sp. CCI4.2]MEB0100191.1 pitrilysin family protein [Pseudomonas sp. CCI3.2]MEB0121051.1 pitrilysin family protein [Pseudomonas sp. CCI1.2]MEB0130089.1 pitrilysin family protein [Pseudomonas sp. CCI2.4]
MRSLLFVCLLLSSAASIALDRFQVEGYQLANGLQVLLKPGNEKGHVAIRLVVGVGFDDFACNDKELPHLLEHLLFSGTDDRGEGGLEERMQALGGEWNAFTSNSDTTFVIEAPARNQRQVLDLLLDILTHSRINQDSLNAAKGIVEHEDGGHYSHLQRWLDHKDLGHSASKQLAVELGLKCAERPDIESLTLEQVEKVRSSWYAANNMTLIVVGDLDRLLPAYLERTYSQLSAIEPGDHPPLAAISHSAQAERTLTKGWLGEGARVHWYFPEPILAQQHDETYELLQDYLDWSLYSTLRLKDGLSYGPWSEREVFGDTGFMSLNADLDRDDVQQAEMAMHDLTVRLQKDGLDPAIFARLREVAIDKLAWAAQGNSALADYYWGSLSDYENGHFADPAPQIKAVSLDTANQALRGLLAQPGYLRIEKPLLNYDELYGVIAGVVALLLLAVALVYRKRKRRND